MVTLPKDWLSREEAEKVFRAQWVKREGLAYRDPIPYVPARDVEAEFQKAMSKKQNEIMGGNTHKNEPPMDVASFRRQWASQQGLTFQSPFPTLAARQPESEFEQAWTARRKTWLDTQTKPNLEGRDLRKANLNDAFLPGVKMTNTRLEGAVLWGANIEGVILDGATLEGADLEGASLQGASLQSASLQGANLGGANLQGADLWGANLQRAILQGANLQSAILEDASLQGASLNRASLQGAILNGASLQGAVLWGANLLGADLRGADFEDADLLVASLESADIGGTRLEGADLSSARLFGNNGDLFEFAGIASFSAANFSGSAFRLADMSDVNVAELKGFDTSFGDNSVKIADEDRPVQWCKDILSDAEFFGRWRGYVDPDGEEDINAYFDGYPPIPPSPC